MDNAKGKEFGCWVDLNCGDIEGPEPDCVFDTGEIDSCLCAIRLNKKEDCKYWRKNDYVYEATT